MWQKFNDLEEPYIFYIKKFFPDQFLNQLLDRFLYQFLNQLLSRYRSQNTFIEVILSLIS